MLTLVRFAPVARYVGRERVITNASCRRARRFSVASVLDRLVAMPSDPRGVEIARLVRERIAMLDELVRDRPDEHWARICPGEGWPVGLETYHVGLGLARQGGWIVDRIGGAPPHDFSWDETNQLNALVARTEGWRVQGNVLVFLREQTDRVARLLLRLSPADWETDAMTYNGKRRSAEFVMRVIALRHIDDHTRSIRAGLEPPS
jgi:DinB family protein